MKDAVIVSTARTPIGRAYRGAFNNLEGPTMASHAIREAVKRAGIDPQQVDDVIMGCAMQQGTTGQNVARQALLAAGLPVTVAGMTIDRQCSSGMMAIATAAKQVLVDGMEVVVGGGVESISLVQNEHYNRHRARDPNALEAAPHIYMSMLETAEVVAKRYKISRQQQDEYALQSQQRTAAAQQAGRFDGEIVPVTASKGVMDKDTREISLIDVTQRQDEGNRPDTSIEGLSSLKPVIEGGRITAGNASQLSDGASAAVILDSRVAER
jgi:acetyl-CoA C-acetyltransferase